MNIEIERKFLVRKGEEFKTMSTSHSHIVQGYMDVKGATVRIRLRDDKAYLTIKGKSADGGLSRYEFEREIPVDDAHEMLKLCRGGVIDKTRWLVSYPQANVSETDQSTTAPERSFLFEVDEFHGANEGLVFAEVELSSCEEEFPHPSFLGPEVTGNKFFYNKHMLSHPYSEWRDILPEEYQ